MSNSSLRIGSFSAANAGLYQVTVSNAYGSATNAAVRVAGLGIQRDGFVMMELAGFPGLSYSVQSNGSLLNGAGWILVGNIALSTSTFSFADLNSPNTSAQYYRVVPLP